LEGHCTLKALVGEIEAVENGWDWYFPRRLTMRILVTGGNGFLGKRLVQELLKRGSFSAAGAAAKPITEIISTDLTLQGASAALASPVSFIAGDLVNPAFSRSLMSQPFDAIFHLASLVSGGAEKDFAAGMSANLWATVNLLEDCRKHQQSPVLVFTSSIATYGGTLPDLVTDDQALTPQSSYGTQKAAAELLIHDYSRKGYLDGRSLRLPIVIIRPERANTAVSGFASALFREPLHGRPAECPLADHDQICVASVASSIRGLIRAAESPAQSWGTFRAVALPGRTVRIDEMIAALRSFAGPEACALIGRKTDPQIQGLVRSWPARFDSARARQVGFPEEQTLADIISDFVQHDFEISQT
jgi:D-erythronate 2-dehydrogenase